MSGDPEGALGDWLAANWPRSSHPEDQPFTLAVRLLALAPSERAELLNLTSRIAAAELPVWGAPTVTAVVRAALNPPPSPPTYTTEEPS